MDTNNTIYAGSVTGTLLNGTSQISYSGQIEDQWSENILTPNDTTFWSLGSCTKSFTATLFGMAVHEKSVTVNEAVLQLVLLYLHDASKIPEALSKITLEQLASMTSGMAGQTFPGVGFPGGYPGYFEALLKRNNYSPNHDYDYSNAGYALLGFALLSQRPGFDPSGDLTSQLLAYMNNELFKPLKMDTATLYPPQPREGFSLPYGYVNGQKQNGSKTSWPSCNAAGALYMTAPDLMTWLSANMNGTIPGGTAFVQSDPVSTLQSNGKYDGEGKLITRGWFIDTFKGPKSGNSITIINKMGDIPGFNCGFAFVKPEKPGGVSSCGAFMADNSGGPVLLKLQELIDTMLYG